MSIDKSGLFDKHSSVCLDFWYTLDKMGIIMVGWKLGSYWRSKGYTRVIED